LRYKNGCPFPEHSVDRTHECSKLRENNTGLSTPTSCSFDTELFSKVVSDVKLGTAADIAGLTAEHIIFSHPVLQIILSIFFQIILSQHIPMSWKTSYMVRGPEIKVCRSKAITCDDFRAITISLILSKVFEYCVLSINTYLIPMITNLASRKVWVAVTLYSLFELWLNLSLVKAVL